MTIETDHSNDTQTGQPLWLAPVVVMRAILEVILHLFGLHAKLKRLRSTARFPMNWRDHWPALRAQEWNRHRMRAHAAAALLAGREPDFSDWQFASDIPDDFGQCPKSAWQMHRRFLSLARFGAEFEQDILRHAHRIATRAGLPLGSAPHGSAGALRAAHHEARASVRPEPASAPFTLMVNRPRSGRPSNHEGERRTVRATRARAPPPTSPVRHALLTSLATPARTRPRARCIPAPSPLPRTRCALSSSPSWRSA